MTPDDPEWKNLEFTAILMAAMFQRMMNNPGLVDPSDWEATIDYPRIEPEEVCKN